MAQPQSCGSGGAHGGKQQQAAVQAHRIKLDAKNALGVVKGNPATEKDMLPLKKWARSRYILHMRGRAYSASLKLQLLLGSPVIAVLSKCREFYYPALKPQKYFVNLPVPLNFWRAKPLLDEIMDGRCAEKEAMRIGEAGRDFVLRELSAEALDCYWATVLVRYGRLYAKVKGLSEANGAYLQL
jgi:Glycosyl transferase family 90